ncbi:Hypp1264 [Branchiostoma lanceolatum]|uniref:Hypp1264 protein n=1 Tax=Branchiostoma lanceolatum TaxID=7740 RepID=A0A8J9ZIJ3_BRALA|nr:Hypp1264 [Branchiostoma lanceolatum]
MDGMLRVFMIIAGCRLFEVDDGTPAKEFGYKYGNLGYLSDVSLITIGNGYHGDDNALRSPITDNDASHQTADHNNITDLALYSWTSNNRPFANRQQRSDYPIGLYNAVS